jgi:hypothetical protein
MFSWFHSFQKSSTIIFVESIKFDFHEPRTVNEACQILAKYGSKARLIAEKIHDDIHLPAGDLQHRLLPDCDLMR